MSDNCTCNAGDGFPCYPCRHRYRHAMSIASEGLSGYEEEPATRGDAWWYERADQGGLTRLNDKPGYLGKRKIIPWENVKK